VVLRKLGEGGEIAKEKAGNGSGGRMDGWFGEKKKRWRPFYPEAR